MNGSLACVYCIHGVCDIHRMNRTSASDELTHYMESCSRLRVRAEQAAKRAESAERALEDAKKDLKIMNENLDRLALEKQQAERYIEDFKRSLARVSEENIDLRTQLHAARVLADTWLEQFHAAQEALGRIERGESEECGLAPHFYGHACQIAHKALGHQEDSYLHCPAALSPRPTA